MTIGSVSSYFVVFRMKDGKVRERIYQAHGHKAAARLAMDDGAEVILSIEREDGDERELRKKVGVRSKLLLPLILGLLVSAAGVAVFWLLRGRPRFW